jgi:hypothetical protein
MFNVMVFWAVTSYGLAGRHRLSEEYIIIILKGLTD